MHLSEVVIFSSVGASSLSAFGGVPVDSGLGEAEGAIPRISEIAAADFDAIFFEALNRARWL